MVPSKLSRSPSVKSSPNRRIGKGSPVAAAVVAGLTKGRKGKGKGHKGKGPPARGECQLMRNSQAELVIQAHLVCVVC